MAPSSELVLSQLESMRVPAVHSNKVSDFSLSLFFFVCLFFNLHVCIFFIPIIPCYHDLHIFCRERE